MGDLTWLLLMVKLTKKVPWLIYRFTNMNQHLEQRNFTRRYRLQDLVTLELRGGGTQKKLMMHGLRNSKDIQNTALE